MPAALTCRSGSSQLNPLTFHALLCSLQTLSMHGLHISLKSWRSDVAQ